MPERDITFDDMIAFFEKLRRFANQQSERCSVSYHDSPLVGELLYLESVAQRSAEAIARVKDTVEEIEKIGNPLREYQANELA